MAHYELIPAFLLLAVIASQSAVVISCNFPPELWCSSLKISKSCHVEKQCAARQYPTADAPKVNFTLYYESYCPGCQSFISSQLYDTYTAISDIMNLTLVPYGNAKETKQGSMYVFQCQHGEKECQGNLLETCILHYAPFLTAFSTIYCMEFTHDPVPNAKDCMTKNGVDFNQVFTCGNGTLGNSLEHEMALKTEALKPPHQFVPWVTLNGEHTDDIQNKAQSDLKKLICDTYQGTKPSACTQEKPQFQSCIRK